MKKALRKLINVLLISCMMPSLCVFNVSAEDVVDEHIYLMPEASTSIIVEGDVDITGFDLNVATIVTNTIEGGDQIAQLGSNRLYDGEFINLHDAVYKFNKVSGIENTYTIESVKNSGLYLNVGDLNNDIFHKNDSENIELRMLNNSGDIQFGLFAKHNNRGLFFEYQESGNKKLDHWYLDRIPNSNEVSLLFHIYKYTQTEGGAPQYEPLNNYPDSGDECIIVAETNATPQTYKYVIYPDSNIRSGPYRQVAKWYVDQRYTAKHELTIVGKTANTASNFKVTKDGVTKIYRVHIPNVPTSVENADVFRFDSSSNDIVQKITIMSGATYKINVVDDADVLYWVSKNSDVATVENGLITAIGTLNGNVFEKTYVGYIDKDNNRHAIEVVVIDSSIEGYKKYVDTYLKIEDNRTEVSYAWILENYYTTVKDWPNSELKDAMDGEVNVGVDKLENRYSLVIFAKTTSDRYFDGDDIKLDGVEVASSDIIDVENYTNDLSDAYNTNLKKLMMTAKDNGWQKAIILNSPESDGNLTKRIYLNSTYNIEVIKSNGQSYSIDTAHILDDTIHSTIDDNFKSQFNLSSDDLDKTIFREYSIKRSSDNVIIENAEIRNSIDLDIDVSSLLNYDTSRIASRKFKVLSKHNGQIVDWGTYEAVDGFIRVPVDKFSPFAIVAVDTLVPPPDTPPVAPPTPSDDTPGRRPSPNTSIR